MQASCYDNDQCKLRVTTTISASFVLRQRSVQASCYDNDQCRLRVATTISAGFVLRQRSLSQHIDANKTCHSHQRYGHGAAKQKLVDNQGVKAQVCRVVARVALDDLRVHVICCVRLASITVRLDFLEPRHVDEWLHALEQSVHVNHPTTCYPYKT